jgi:hypothetical protein
MPLIFGAEGRRSNAFASRGELPPHSAISGTGRRLAVLAVRAETGLKLIRARLAPLTTPICRLASLHWLCPPAKNLPIGVAAVGCPALVTSVVRRAMLRGRLSRLSHGNRGGAEIAPISCATTKQRPVPAGPHAGHYGSRSIEARAAKVERALGPNDDCAPPG